MPTTPPEHLIELIDQSLTVLLTKNPLATSSEAFVREMVEMAVVSNTITPRYGLRIGINYHGDKVQHIILDDSGRLVGWNPNGDALKAGKANKLQMSGVTIFDRLPGEHNQSDAKFYGGNIPNNEFIRAEFKVRGWLGKTRNLDGAQFLKDLNLLGRDNCDLIVACLSEVAYRKWRNEGPDHQTLRRSGTDFFVPLLPPCTDYDSENPIRRTLYNYTPPDINGRTVPGHLPPQPWHVFNRVVIADRSSVMPGAKHYVLLCWR